MNILSALSYLLTTHPIFFILVPFIIFFSLLRLFEVFTTPLNMPAEGKHAPWRLWILILAWIFQLIFLLIALGIYIIVVVALKSVTEATSKDWV